jgi:hypothetical protein
MIGRLLRGLVALAVYACVATVLAQAILIGYAVRTWGIDRQKAVQMLAIAYGIDLFAMHDRMRDDSDRDSPEQPSYEQILQTRAVKVRDLELREQALREGLDQLRLQQQEMADARKRYEQIKAAFDEQLAAIRDEAQAGGMDDARAKLEAIRPAQAKELLVQMIKDGEMPGVVALLRDMPTMKAARIIGEFKTPEELEQIGEVLRLIREGHPAAELAASTRENLEIPRTGNP